MKRWLKIIFFLIIAFNLILASWYFLHGDLYFHSDIARDFMLLHELETKKIILIGARTGAAGVFHGPLWYYIMFPIYFLSHGNPVAVGWFWIFLVVTFLFGSFQIAKRLFDEKTAYLYTLLVSTFVIFQTRALSHPDGTWLTSPLFFYLFWKYIKTLKVKYLAASVILSGLMIHFELVVGIPLFLMSLVLALFVQIKKRKLAHALTFFLILIPLSTYIIFDIRHDFFQLKSLITYIAEGKHASEGLLKIFNNRLDYMTTTGAQFIQQNEVNKIIFAFFFIVLIKHVIKSKSRPIYVMFLYFFLGFFIFSLLSPYSLLRHHFLAFIPVVFMIFAALAASRYGKFLLPLLFLSLVFNELAAVNFVKSSQDFIGKSKDSWKLLNKIGSDVFEKSQGEFGYFVNSPDLLGYAPKYAMIYAQKNHPGKKAFYFTKKHITYVITAPLPSKSPVVLPAEVWPGSAINLTNNPASQDTYPNGYKIFRFQLSQEDAAQPFNKDLDTGLLYR